MYREKQLEVISVYGFSFRADTQMQVSMHDIQVGGRFHKDKYK